MYEREGLVIPSRRTSGHRAYTEEQLARIRCYRQTMARDKVTIAHLKRLLSLIPCWEIKECPESARAACKAYPSREAPCWEVTGKSWQSMCGECLECEVYKQSQDAGELVRVIARHTRTSAPEPEHL
jgi:MerR family transcriptional regulator/heat shock protein HspR